MEDLGIEAAMKFVQDIANEPKQSRQEQERQALLEEYKEKHEAFLRLITSPDPSQTKIERELLIATYQFSHDAFVGFLSDLTDRVANLEERLKKNRSDA